MSNFETVLAAASRLPVVDRLRLIDQLAASVPDDQPPSLSQEWLAEIARRSSEIDAGSVATETWEGVRKRVFDKHGVEGAN